MEKITELKELARNIRLDVLRMTYEKKAGFIGSSFSCADILAVLYGSVMRYDKNDMNKEGTDVFFLSKGHAASALYAALANKDIINKETLDNDFHVSGSKMGVHPKRNSMPGIITSSGSLGQGAGQGCGYALAEKIKKTGGKVYVLLGDGECNEGSNWEAFMFASKYKLNNLTIIVDRNKLQSYGHDADVLNMGDLKSRFESFGFYAVETDGNDINSLVAAFDDIARETERPCAVIANTIKGKGFSEFEDKVVWHYKWPENEHFIAAQKELNNE